ncbi:hypothetical protein E2C01_002932 [Portunus trituberculatus]|uniref:Uncharacterized protein n=1 Tax=Portunus trituberculatus TaxID=210409 RepID=A0A5B7CMM1_PORTR|nr:hypothetical protein [Portunus trituberculatus]
MVSRLMSSFIQFFFKLCTLCAVTTSINAFHFSPFCVENCISQYPSHTASS